MDSGKEQGRIGRENGNRIKEFRGRKGKWRNGNERSKRYPEGEEIKISAKR